MPSINVQFSDGTKTTIVSYFGSAQDSDIYPNLGAIDSSDLRWKSYYGAQPTLVQPYLPTPN